MSEYFVVFLIGSVCYGMSTVFGIRLGPALTVPTAAAIAPAVALAGSDASGTLTPFVSLWVPVCIAAVALSLAKRSPGEIAGHLVLCVGTFLALSSVAGSAEESSVMGLIVALATGAMYLLGDLLRQTVLTRHVVPLRGLEKMLVLLHVVVLSACGLTVLVVGQLGWGAFIAMAGVLGITRYEFEAFGKSRSAFEQTMAALGNLKLKEAQLGAGPRIFDHRQQQ